MPSFETTLEREDQEYAVVVEYKYWKATQGARGRFGEPLEPNDDEEIEIQSVTDANGKQVDLTNDETNKIEQLCWDDVESRSCDYDEP